MLNICMIGSSTMWMPQLTTDLFTVFDQPIEFRLVDIDLQTAQLCAEWGQAANKHHGRSDTYIPTTDRRQALRDADAVLITISTGGLDAMENDIKIPQNYGIYATVADTSGPAGWSRSIRNIPVFREFAMDFQQICPNAFIANYTNPMSSLTAALQQSCDNPVAGLCHAYFDAKDMIQHVFKLKNWDSIALSIAGVNHFAWVVDIKIGREDGYKLLREKIASGSLCDLLPEETADEIGYLSSHQLCSQLYDAFGYLPYPGDRHICEFVSFALTGTGDGPKRSIQNIDGQDVEVFDYCQTRRTSVDSRRKTLPLREQKIRDWIDGKEQMPAPSRETSAQMIAAYLTNKPFVEAVNTINVGQIPGLPLGACVETLGVIDGMGIRPVIVENVPENLLEIMRPAAICQRWITQGVLENNKELLLQALYRDQQCAHLKPNQVRQMAQELFEANKEFVSF